MLIWAIAATALALAAAVIILLNRRQVRKTCRQLAFMRKNETNMRLTSDLPAGELNKLIDLVNGMIDDTERIRREALRGEESLKEAVTGISHDIRTPLTSLDGYFQLLSQSCSDEERAHYIGIIQGRISSLKDMLEELFTYAKLQNSAYEIECGQMDISKCAVDAMFTFYEDFKKHKIEPQVEVCEERLLINGNEEAVRRLVQNLLKNALEHGKSSISVRLFEKDSEAVFVCENDMEDTGDIDINKVFERFYKADSARAQTSTGLGLAISKALTEKMGGRISAEINGSVFRVTAALKTTRLPK
ncbi:MAG: sensor histidine kinase [Oscillospiraceae bacterium]